MRLAWILAAGLALAPLAAAAQQEQREALFIAPMGQPFRGETTAAAMQAWFAAADTDQDGRLSRDEFVAQGMLLHPIMDRNQDGLVTAIEAGNLFRATAPEMYAPLPPLRGAQARMPRDPGRMTQPRERVSRDDRARGAARFGLLGDIEPVMSCDADMSRWVSAGEFQTCAERRFQLLDANGDGFFEISESPRAAELIENPPPP